MSRNRLQWSAFACLMLAFAFLVVASCAPAYAKGSSSSSSRSYSSGSFGSSSRSYSAPSSSRSYSAPSFSRSTPASTPSTRTYTPQSFSRPAAPSTASSRTYSAPPRPTGPPVTYGGRQYVPVPYYHPAFVSPGYYYSYGGGGMPWWFWLMLWNQHQQSYQVQTEAGPVYYQAGQTSYNWIGFVVWAAVLAVIAYVVYRVWFRTTDPVHYHY